MKNGGLTGAGTLKPSGIRNNRALRRLLVFMFILYLLVFVASANDTRVQQIARAGDSIGYRQLATSLTHGSYEFDGGGPTAFRMPGYPLVLAAVHLALAGTWGPVVVLQIIVSLGTVVLVYEIGQLLCPNTSVPLLAAVLVAFNPLLVLSSISILPETLAIAAVTFCVWLMIRGLSRTGYLWLGMALAVSLYLKPTLVGFVLVMLLLLIGRQLVRANRESGAVVQTILPTILVGLMLLPWTIRNFATMQSFVPLTTSGGSNLYGGNNSLADGGYVSSQPYVLTGMDEVSSDRLLRQQALDWIRHHSGKFLLLIPAKAARFFWPLSLGTGGMIDVPPIASIVILLATALFYGLGLHGIWRIWRAGKRWEALVVLTVPLSLLIPSLIAFGSTRFALPAMPSLSVVAAVGLVTLADRVKRRAVRASK